MKRTFHRLTFLVLSLLALVTSTLLTPYAMDAGYNEQTGVRTANNIEIRLDEMCILDSTGDIIGAGELNFAIIVVREDKRDSRRLVGPQEGWITAVKGDCIYLGGFTLQLNDVQATETIHVAFFAADQDKLNFGESKAVDYAMNAVVEAGEGIFHTGRLVSKINPVSFLFESVLGTVIDLGQEEDKLDYYEIELNRANNWYEGRHLIETMNRQLSIDYTVCLDAWTHGRAQGFRSECGGDDEPINTPAATNTPTRTPTRRPAATNTPTRTPTRRPAATNTPTRTPTRRPAATNTPTRTPTRRPAATNSPLPRPTNTPRPTATSATVGKLYVITSQLNVRSGPGTSNPAIGQVNVGYEFALLGRNSDSSWLEVCCVNGSRGWVINNSEYISLDRNAVAVALTAAAPPPTSATCNQPVDSELTGLWNRSKMGCPTTSAQIVWASYTRFQRGWITWRRDTFFIYGFFDNGRWLGTLDRWDQVSPVPSRGSPPTGLLAPVRGAGYIWGTNDAFFENLGWATNPQTGFCARIQSFEKGFILRSSTTEQCHEEHKNPVRDANFMFIAVYDNGYWER